MSAPSNRPAETGPIAVPYERHLCECGAVATVWYAPGGKIIQSIHCDKHAPTLGKRGAT